MNETLEPSPPRELRNFLDAEGRIRQWPARRRLQLIALEFLATQFEAGRDYSERQVNELLDQFHTFSDAAMLRRELFDLGRIGRTADGARYWKIARPE